MDYRWRIFLANLDPVKGSEQGNTRPVLVISSEEINKLLPVVNVLPITSKKTDRKIYPNEVMLKKGFANIERDSIILCYQIRTLDKSRLIKEIGKIEEDSLKKKILDALSFQLEIYS
ncbi:MAG TPA: type II toxin-antitoxin system PemK/MazF family toxin [Methanofastidiosum sp.]|nr:type II toxin-antitoxin system PemK/MazF family toxin [Methanofastidiosum sp.]HPA49697.1 type II toxin-antitoxin system PemK/MazF family toxin [Methanofastidiosum sp.]HQK62602.1 type II toxin-antitoxin system PemK/MazF family toxin [Methanofastidiosum sp.]HQQ49387.1 type II toxin-antitoxin system PemK/MazF family toxin [Methanofastidiosum sp.]